MRQATVNNSVGTTQPVTEEAASNEEHWDDSNNDYGDDDYHERVCWEGLDSDEESVIEV